MRKILISLLLTRIKKIYCLYGQSTPPCEDLLSKEWESEGMKGKPMKKSISFR